MSEYVIHIEDAKTLYNLSNFAFPIDAYLRNLIVRCRDCEYYGNSGVDDGYCYYWNTCDFGDCIRDTDDFCSRGSRKEA